MQNISGEELKGIVGEFSWNFGMRFFIQTAKGNFIWEESEEKNEVRPFTGSFEQWIKLETIPFCRDKGKHTIGGYCGNFIYNPEPINP
jgi:hypothetical protein